MNAADVFRFCIGALVLLVVNSAAADSEDLLSVNAVVTRTYLDNLFKRPSNGGAGSRPSDSVTTTQIGIAAHKAISLQAFELAATLVDNRYRQFDALNSQSNNYNAAWRWQLTPHLTGAISSSRQQSQTDFADYRGPGQNLRTNESRRANAEWNVMGGWTIGAGLTKTKQINSQTFVEDASNEQRVADTLVRYAFPSATSIAFNASRSQGDYSRAPNPLTLSDSRFTESREGLSLAWPITGRTKLTTSLGQVSRRNENFGARDFVGRNDNLKLDWAPTGKLSLTVSRARMTESREDISSSFSVRSTTDLTGTLQIGAKLSLGASVGRETRTFGGFALVPAAFSRLDKTGKESLTLSWAAMRNVTLMAAVQQSRRTSTDPGTDYSDRSATLSATASF